MVSFFVKGRVKPDGNLEVDIPTGLPETDVDVLVVVQPLCPGRDQAAATTSWPEGFFKRTFGCLAHDPLERPPQLQQEHRESLL